MNETRDDIGPTDESPLKPVVKLQKAIHKILAQRVRNNETALARRTDAFSGIYFSEQTKGITA